MPYPHLLSPLKVGSRTLRNRVLVTGHVPGLADGGVPGERYIAYHRARAKGGVGLQLTGATPVHRTSAQIEGAGLINIDERIVPGYRRLAAAVRPPRCPPADSAPPSAASLAGRSVREPRRHGAPCKPCATS